MLVLSRKIGQRVLIGDNIAVTVVKLNHGGVRLGIEAPPELAVVREELATKLAAGQASFPSLAADVRSSSCTDRRQPSIHCLEPR